MFDLPLEPDAIPPPGQAAGVAPLDLGRLTESARDFAESLFARMPALADYAGLAPGADGGHVELVVSLPTWPESSVTAPLRIDTEFDEVTVTFDAMHKHFQWPPYEGYEDDLLNPVVLIWCILTERVVAGSLWRGDALVAARFLYRVPDGQLIDALESTLVMAAGDAAAIPLSRHIRSWYGSHNEETAAEGLDDLGQPPD